MILEYFSKFKNFIRHLTCLQWLMIVIFIMFFYSLQYPTNLYVKISSPEETFVSCDPLQDRCPHSFESIPFDVRLKIDETYLQGLEKRILKHHYNRSGFSMVHNHGCKSAFRTAIIVPYRDRNEHLQLFLQHMHRFLPRQQIDYAIYIIEQGDELGFNRGKLFNVGFKEALKDHDYCCFIFHDVDLLPENIGNLYTCSNQPRHMSVAIDVFNYLMPYGSIFGGVAAIQKEHFELLNGFPNRFYGWGAEDDDLAGRVSLNNLKIIRWPVHLSRYTMLSHKTAAPNPDRFKMLAESESLWRQDGLNNLQYKLLTIQRNPLYTKVSVDFKTTS